MSLQVRIVGSACLAMTLVGCGGAPVATPGAATQPNGGSANPAAPATAITSAPSLGPSPTVEPTLAVTAAPTSPPTTGAFSLGAAIWWSGWEIGLTGGTFDAVKHTLTINATFKNTGTQGSELRSVSDSTIVAWNAQDLPAFVTSGIVAAGATGNAQIQAAVPPTFDVATAVLTFGKSDEHQALVPLSGAEPTFDQASHVAFTGKITMGKYVSYTITSFWILPASCSGYPDRIKYGPLKANLESIVVFGTATSKDATNYRQIDRGYLILPDGSKLSSVPQMSLSLALNASLKNEAMCFAVATPYIGTYKIGMHEYRSNATGTLAIPLQ